MSPALRSISMPKVVRARSLASDWWPAVLAGVAVGAALAWIVLRRPVTEPDLAALTARLHAREGADELRVRSLGQGIIELVGSAPDALDVGALIQALATERGVSVVVNRVWTPGSIDALAAVPLTRPDDPSPKTDVARS